MCDRDLIMNVDGDKYYLLKGEELQLLVVMLDELKTVIQNTVDSKTSYLPEKGKNNRDTLICHDLF